MLCGAEDETRTQSEVFDFFGPVGPEQVLISFYDFSDDRSKKLRSPGNFEFELQSIIHLGRKGLTHFLTKQVNFDKKRVLVPTEQMDCSSMLILSNNAREKRCCKNSLPKMTGTRLQFTWPIFWAPICETLTGHTSGQTKLLSPNLTPGNPTQLAVLRHEIFAQPTCCSVHLL